MSNTVEITSTRNEVTVSETGPVGPKGVGLIIYTDSVDTNVVVGDVVYKTNAGNIDKALADGSIVPRVAGMIYADASTGSGAQYKMEGVIERQDWSSIQNSGTSSLSEGVFYYLSATNAGNISTSAPTTVGQYVVQVGYAQSATQLNLQIQPPIKL